MPAIGSYEERPPRRTAPYFGWRCADASNWSMWMRVGFGCHSLGQNTRTSLADDFCFRTLLERLLKRTVTDWPYSAILALSFASILRRELQFPRLRGFGADLRVDVASAPCPQHGASFCLEHRAPTHEGASASGACRSWPRALVPTPVVLVPVYSWPWNIPPARSQASLRRID